MERKIRDDPAGDIGDRENNGQPESKAQEIGYWAFFHPILEEEDRLPDLYYKHQARGYSQNHTFQPPEMAEKDGEPNVQGRLHDWRPNVLEHAVGIDE